MAKAQGIAMYVVPRSIARTVKSISNMNKQIEAAVTRVIAEAAINIQREAKENAPVNFGFLRASIYLDFKGKGKMTKTGIKSGAKQLTIPAPPAKSRKDGTDAFVGSDLNYSGRMEHRDRFLYSAYSKWAPRVKPAIEKSFRNIILKTK